MSLESLLRGRITEARERIAGHRAAITREERNLKRWEDALALEMDWHRGAIDPDDQLPQTLTLSEAKNKEAILERFLGQAEYGLTSAQLVQLVHPAVARSSVFACLKRMKNKGVIVQNQNGVIKLARQDQTANPAEAGLP